jgi:glycosyltransferase involved in cell wall biosynthesis
MRIVDWWLAVPRFWQAMRRLRPDVVILSLPQANIAGRIAASLAPRCVIASFEHSTHLARRPYETLFRITSRRVDWMLSDCLATAREAAERLYWARPSRRFVLPLVSFEGGDPSPAGPYPVVGETVRLVSAGRFAAVKNQRVMIEAVAELVRRSVPVHLTLFGDGHLLEECRTLASDLGVGNRVSFPGFRPDWMEAPADIFLLSSRYEGLCIAAIEAMSRGLPVIAPPVGGLREYGPEAEVLNPKSITGEDIADAVECLAYDPERMRSMREAGLRVIEKHFSGIAVARQYRAFKDAIDEIVNLTPANTL